MQKIGIKVYHHYFYYIRGLTQSGFELTIFYSRSEHSSH